MICAGIREVKNQLSRLLVEVKAGTEILITERGKPIARIVREKPGGDGVRASLAPLMQSGLVVWPSRGLVKDDIPAIGSQGKMASEMVIEDRR